MTGTVQQLVRTLADDHPRGGHVETGLLVSLVEACSGVRSAGGGRHGGGGMPFNADAVDLARLIRGDLLRDLIRLGEHLRVGPLADVLRHWHTAWTASYPTAGEEAAWIETLTRWEAEIRRVIASHERAPVQDGECPICGQTRFTRDGTEGWALLREWQHDDPHGSMRLTCLPCGEVLAVGAKAVAVTLGIDMATELDKIAKKAI